MIWIIIGVSLALILVGIILFLLYHFGMINCYHPLKKAKDKQIRVACVGDSITHGLMVSNWRKNNYPAVLGKMLGEDFCVNNFGYTNRTLIKSGDYPFVKEKLYKQSLDFKPNIVFIMLGSNDSKENNWNREKFINDYSELIDSYLKLESSPNLYILTPPPVFEVGKKVLYKLRKDIIDKEICESVKYLAKTKGIKSVDIYKVFEGKKELFADGVHPNVKGSKLLAQKVFEVLAD